MRLQGKVALITGAARGMGAVEAELFSREGACVVIADVLSDQGRRTESEILRSGGTAFYSELDVTNEKQWINVIRQTVDRYEKLDILVNNAGISGEAMDLEHMDTKFWDQVMDVNAKGVFLGMKHAIPVMRRSGGGSIINISSIAGKRGYPHMSAYCASKFAIIGLTQSMAQELGPHGINVNAVCPGAVDTHRNDVLGRGERWKAMAANTPIRRNGTDDETGAFCVYLCTDAASWIHGQSINILSLIHI